MTKLIDDAIAMLTDARSAWDRGAYHRCLRLIFDATKCCKDAARMATERAVWS